jgi:hypothetical protein
MPSPVFSHRLHALGGAGGVSVAQRERGRKPYDHMLLNESLSPVLAWFLPSAFPAVRNSALGCASLTEWLSPAAQIPPGVGRALSPPIIGHGGRLIACSGKNLLAFHRNGSFAWIVPLGYNCRQDISLVTERDKVMI